MERPSVRHEYYHPDSDVTYVVMAFRQLTRGEVLRVIRLFNGMRKPKKPWKRGAVVSIEFRG